MAKKNQFTTTNPIEWDSLQEILGKLREDGNFRFMLIVAGGMYMGLRIGDLLRLRWIDLIDKDILELRETKTGKPRRITINGKLKKIITESYKNWAINGSSPNKDEYVFLNREKIKPISIQYVNRMLHQLFSRYKIACKKSPSSHSLRKSFAKKIFENHGCSDAGLILISAMFGHNNSAVTRRYIGLESQQFEDVYLNL